ncbi:MAG: hypothetical protein P1V19_24765, partial [Gimesia sp.]|nr:hypothetical protein [Gimesia sp.]
MTPSQPYTRAEIKALGNTLPDRGVFCPLCNNYIPEFEDLSPQESVELKKLEMMPLVKALRNKTGCSLKWAKIWALHPDGIHPLPSEPTAPCLFCGVPLHPNAGQCLLCKMDWHDPQNPVSLGDSIADQILTAAPGSTISVFG